MSEEMEREDTSLMDDLAAAWDAAEGGSDEAESGVSEPLAASEQEVEPVPQDDPAGGDDPTRESGDVSGGTEPSLNAEGEEGAPSLDEPPRGLSAAAREAWASTPDAVKAEIAKREADYARGIEKRRMDSERLGQMTQAMQPFQQYFAMNNQSPPQAVHQLLQTASLLQMGSPEQKAQTVAQLINQFGVDIETLDRAIVGEAPPPEVQQQSQIEQMLNQRIQPIQQQLQQYQQREQQMMQRSQAEVQSEIHKFAAENEFYGDVHMDMADIMDAAANHGVQMTLAEAYDRACKIHPEVSKIIAARGNQQQMQTKRNAASSVHGTPGGSANPQVSNNVRDAIEAAWDNAGRM